MGQKTRSERHEWAQAVNLLRNFESSGSHLDDLLDRRPLERTRWLVMEVFRCWWIIEHLLEKRVKRAPRPAAMAILRLALAECLNREEEAFPRIIHYAVDAGHACGLEKAEAGFINGVLRAVVRSGDLRGDLLGKSHPAWMVDRWKAAFGEENTTKLLDWNQREATITFFARDCPPYGKPTPWDGYYSLSRGMFGEARKDLESGRVYIQDPFARIPVELLNVQPGECVLDLCAAPGGKSRRLAEALSETGRLVLVDRPGRRMERLRENARHFPGGQVMIIASAIEELVEAGAGENLLPGSADAVLIDVPCSNTGVIQKRPDVKVRLSEDRITRASEYQLALITHAARWVRPGGRLVYSTCSIEPEENADVVHGFLENYPDWQLARTVMSHPWECGHDGGGAFLLTKASSA